MAGDDLPGGWPQPACPSCAPGTCSWRGVGISRRVERVRFHREIATHRRQGAVRRKRCFDFTLVWSFHFGDLTSRVALSVGCDLLFGAGEGAVAGIRRFLTRSTQRWGGVKWKRDLGSSAIAAVAQCVVVVAGPELRSDFLVDSPDFEGGGLAQRSDAAQI